MTTTDQRVTMPAALLSTDLLEYAERSHAALLAAASASSASSRYLQAQTGAVRAAASLLAQLAPRTAGSPPRSAWEALRRVAPEFTEDAEFFAATARRGRAVSAGVVQVTSREADDLVREVEAFLARVLAAVGLPPMSPIGGLLPVAGR